MTKRSIPLLARAAGLAVLLLTTSAPAEEWTEVKDNQGRTLTVKIESVKDNQVTFSIKNGKSYTYPITKFSITDQVTLRRWKPAPGSDSPVKEDSKVEAVSASDTSSVYRSKHFEFELIGGGTEAQVTRFAPLFESVHWAFSSLPVEIDPKPAESHFKVKLYASESDFEIASQETLAENQPAIYNLGNDTLLGPIERIKPSAALTKEIAFAMLGEKLNTLPPWLAVGLTEYVAAAPYRDHALDLKDPLANMVAYLASEYGMTSKSVPMLSPTSVLSLDYNALRAPGLEGSKSRSSALLTFYYFAHLDGEGKGKALEGYLLALRTQASPEDALGRLTGGREARLVDDGVKVAYIPKKLRVAFIK